MKRQFSRVLIVSLLGLWITFWCALPLATDSGQSLTSESQKEFEEYVKEQMALDKAPGLSVGFLKGDKIWTRAFGFSDLENKVPAKPESSYRLASITKTLTAIAVLQLVEAGKIDLDAEVQTYVPYFPKKKWPVTVRLLLGHLGGISHYKNYAVEGRIKVRKNTKQALAIFQDFDLVAEPGTKFNYSSYGYNLLGAVIEEASGVSYGNYIKEHIFEPLGMTDSRIDDPIEIIPNRVRGYRLIRGKIKNSEYVNVSSRFAGGGTRSTIVDLLKYAHGIIEGALLKEETWKLIFTSMATQEELFTEYGMGWRVSPWRGHFMVSHGGSQPETRTHLLIFPSEEFAVAIASNREGLNLMPYIRRLAELVLDEDFDSSTYVSENAGQIIYNACNSTFSYGMSHFDWHGKHTSKDEKDLTRAFDYFNKHVNEKALKKNFNEEKNKIKAGLHPISDQAIVKVGTFMASCLKETLGEDMIQIYHKSGPLAFFSDYIKISQKWPSSRKKYKFTKNFTNLISRWEKDWKTTYIDTTRHLFITINTDFDLLGPVLKKTFAKATLYPDFTGDMERVGRYLFEKNEILKSLDIFKLGYELYPNSPASRSNLAAAYIWAGNAEEARRLFKEAFALDPEHRGVSINQFFNLARRLESKGKIKEIFAVADIAMELYPKNAQLHKNVADIYLRSRMKKRAIHFYKKALEIDPKLESAKKILERLEKEK
ncbi:MAG: serine hydrolase [Candidatus Aminicenantes bacterium]|nr:MAG: serine hydrolase [Candidatus Aminicenantes bacterium]